MKERIPPGGRHGAQASNWSVRVKLVLGRRETIGRTRYRGVERAALGCLEVHNMPEVLAFDTAPVSARLTRWTADSSRVRIVHAAATRQARQEKGLSSRPVPCYWPRPARIDAHYRPRKIYSWRRLQWWKTTRRRASTCAPLRFIRIRKSAKTRAPMRARPTLMR